FADAERVSHGAIGSAGGDEAEDLDFSIGERVRRASVVVCQFAEDRFRAGELRVRAELLERLTRGRELEPGCIGVAQAAVGARPWRGWDIVGGVEPAPDLRCVPE